MRSLRDARAREEIVRRIGRLTPHSPRRWGEMEIERVMPHLADALRMALGVIECAPPSGPTSHWPLSYRHLDHHLTQFCA